MRCYAWRLGMALIVGLLLAALAVASSKGRLALWPQPPGSVVTAPVPPTERDPGCFDSTFDAMQADHRGGAVVTAC